MRTIASATTRRRASPSTTPQAAAPGAGASYGRDVIDGGPGNDALHFDASTTASAIVVDLAAGTLSGGSSNPVDGARIVGIESVWGGRFDDRMTGDSGNNAFSGGGGN